MTIMIIRNLSLRFHLVSSIVSSIHAFHLRVQLDDPSHFHCYERPLTMFEGGRTYSGALRRFLWRRHPHVKRHHFVMHASKEEKKNRLKMNQHDRSSSTEVPHENSRRQTFQDKRRTHFIDMPSYLVVSEATSGLTFSSVFKRLQFTVHTCTHSHELRWFGDARASERKPWPM